MATQTANIILQTSPRGVYNTYVVTNALQLYAGMLVGTLAAGTLDLWPGGDVATSKFVGVVEFDVLGNTGASPQVRARVDVSGRTLLGVPVAGASTIANVNDLVYSTTSNASADLTVTPNTNVKAIGWIKSFNSATSFDVELFTPSEYLGQ
jgi:hypothetical protein